MNDFGKSAIEDLLGDTEMALRKKERIILIVRILGLPLLTSARDQFNILAAGSLLAWLSDILEQYAQFVS